VSIGGGANPYFLHYLSSLSRGKTVHLMDPDSVERELVGLLAEIQSPLCRDLTVDIGVEGNQRNQVAVSETVHPFPVPDLYRDRAVLLKVTVPESSPKINCFVTGIVHSVDGNKNAVEIPVLSGDDNEALSFPMELALAHCHLNRLHSKIWWMRSGGTASDRTAVDRLRATADAISDETGISSPTRTLQSVLEMVRREQSEHNVAGHDSAESLLRRDRSALALPERTGRGARTKRKDVSGQKKAAAIAVAATLGSVAVVAVVNPFGGDDSIFGGVDADDTAGCSCDCGGDDGGGDSGSGACPCCDDESCVIL